MNVEDQLTIGKKYNKIEDYYGYDYTSWLINDNGIEQSYNNLRFIKLEEYREKQLNEIFLT